MSEYFTIHEVLIKTQFVYPTLMLILTFSIYETVREYMEGREQKKWNKNIY
jgi:hypothetical protein